MTCVYAGARRIKVVAEPGGSRVLIRRGVAAIKSLHNTVNLCEEIFSEDEIEDEIKNHTEKKKLWARAQAK